MDILIPVSLVLSIVTPILLAMSGAIVFLFKAYKDAVEKRNEDVRGFSQQLVVMQTKADNDTRILEAIRDKG